MMPASKIASPYDDKLNPDTVRKEFPIFYSRDWGKYPLTYLDSAASAQKPKIVIETVQSAMEKHYANIHRGIYKLSQESTTSYEDARNTVANFLNAGSEYTAVFTKNATEAINLVASSWGRNNLNSGDEILLSELEHHANIVAWHILAQEKGLKIKYVPLKKEAKFGLDIEKFQELISNKTKLIAITHMSNVTGEILPVQKIVQMARNVGAKILLDGSQAAVHLDINLQDLNPDFYVITGHKLYGPTGIGALIAKTDILNSMPPYQGGGDMIENVSFEKITYKSAPARFEAGTPAFVEAAGLKTAIDYINSFNRETVHVHEDNLANFAIEEMQKIEGITIYGKEVENSGAIISFNIQGVHPHDAATIFDQMNICIRAGQHCAEPFMLSRQIPATIRVSFAIYNTLQDVENLIIGLKKIKKLLG